MEGWILWLYPFFWCLFYLDFHHETDFNLKAINQIGMSTGEKNPSSHPRLWPVRWNMTLLWRASKEISPHPLLGSHAHGISLTSFLRTGLPHSLPWEPSVWESSVPRSHEWASLNVELGSASLTNSPGDCIKHPSLGSTVIGLLSWRQEVENWVLSQV